MFSFLLSLAFLGVGAPVGFSEEVTLCWASPHCTQIASAKTSAKVVFVRPAAQHADGERDCIEESDPSDDVSSSKQRTEAFGEGMSRYALALFRTQLDQSAEVPRNATLPLFYAFCRLLL